MRNEPVEEEQLAEIALDPVVEELKAAKDQLLRLAAEFDNFKKRSQREREEAWTNARAELFKVFLPVLDNFGRAMADSAEGDCPPQAYKKGMDMIYQQFTGVFAAAGVEAFGAPGEPFDPLIHHAVAHVEDDALGPNEIAAVYSPGYRMKDRVLREAMVGVAN